MKFKKIVPYVFVTLLGTNSLDATGSNDTIAIKSFIPDGRIALKPLTTPRQFTHSDTIEYNTREQRVHAHVDTLMQTYIGNAMSGAENIKKLRKKRGYKNAVRTELPGAPVNLHCLYGQWMQLSRALDSMGDTISPIPHKYNAFQSSPSFIQQMSKLYDNAGFPGAIHRGRVYRNDAEYNNAMNKYVNARMRGRRGDTDSIRNVLAQQFAQKNYSIDCLNPGTIMIVPASHGATPTHAIMYLGRGHVTNGEFVADTNGAPMCCAYNNEHVATDLFRLWDTHRTFAADMSVIIANLYNNELARADSLANVEIEKRFHAAYDEKNPYKYLAWANDILAKIGAANIASTDAMHRPSITAAHNVARNDAPPAPVGKINDVIDWRLVNSARRRERQ